VSLFRSLRVATEAGAEDLALEQMSRATREMAWKLRSATSNPSALGPQTRARGGSGVSVGART